MRLKLPRFRRNFNKDLPIEFTEQNLARAREASGDSRGALVQLQRRRHARAPEREFRAVADPVLFFTLNREDFSFVIHLDRQPRTPPPRTRSGA